MKNLQDKNDTVKIMDDIRLPGTNIILEAGDEIKIFNGRLFKKNLKRVKEQLNTWMIARMKNLQLNYGGDVDFEDSFFEGPYTSSDVFKNRDLLREITNKWLPELVDIEYINSNFSISSAADIDYLFEIIVDNEAYTMGLFDVIDSKTYNQFAR